MPLLQILQHHYFQFFLLKLVILFLVPPHLILWTPDLRRILEQLLDELAGKVVVVHYRNIERDFFDTNLRALINEGIVFPVIDTMQIEADKQKEQTQGFINWLKKKKTQSIRLANSRLRYNLPPYQPHDALTDAIATAELLQAQISYHFTPKTAIKDLWL